MEMATPKDKQLQEVAREYAERLGVRGFKASGSWLRGWKGRCRQEGGKKKKTRNVPATKPPSAHTASSAVSTSSTMTASATLSTLTEQEKRGVVHCPRHCVVVKPSSNEQIFSIKEQVSPAAALHETNIYSPPADQQSSSASASAAGSYQSSPLASAAGSYQ